MRRSRGGLVLLLLIVGVLLASLLLSQGGSPEKRTYSEIIDLFDQGKIENYSLNISNGKLTFREKGEKNDETFSLPSASLFIDDVKDIVKAFEKNEAQRAAAEAARKSREAARYEKRKS